MHHMWPLQVLQRSQEGRRLALMYEGDSFFTLTVLERAGLVLWSLAMVAGSLWLMRIAVRRAHWAVRLAGAAVAFWAFVWLSPQLYYAYYLMIFDGLPLQIVVRWPPGPGALIELLGFQTRATLSEHSKGVLGWIMVAVALWPPQAVKSDVSE